jgi:cytochrome c-type biogenesis protein CcmH/NrfG
MPTQQSAPARVSVVTLFVSDQTQAPKESHWPYFATLWITGELREARAVRMLPYRAVEYAYRKCGLAPGSTISVANARAIGTQLGAVWVLQSSYRKRQGEWEMSAQLIRTKDGKIQPVGTARSADWFAVCDRICIQTLQALRITPEAAEKGRMFWQATRVPQALARYSLTLTPAFQNKPLEAQEAALRDTLTADPDFAPALRYLASVLNKRRQPSLAEEAVRRALKLRPEDPSGHRVLGDILATQQRYPEAERAYREALRLNPDDTACLTALAQLLQLLVRVPEAIPLAEQAIALDPTDAGARSLLATLYANRRKMEKAIAVAREATRLEPEDVPALFTLAMVTEMDGEDAQATRLYRQCRELVQRTGRAREMLPLIEERLKFLQNPGANP